MPGGGPAPTIPLRPGIPTATPTIPLRPTPVSATPSAEGVLPIPSATQALPQATTKLKQTQPLTSAPPPNLQVPSIGTRAPIEEEEPSDMINVILAALLLVTTILLGMIEYSKSRVAEVQQINAVSKNASFTDLLGQ